MTKDSKGGTHRRAFAFKRRFVNKYILPRVRWSQPVLPREVTPTTVEDMGRTLGRAFEPFVGLTSEELAARLEVHSATHAKSYYADVTKAILGIDIDNALEDVIVRTVRLDYGRTRPRESVSFPAFDYLELVEEQWMSSTLRERLRKPFLFVVFQQERPDGPRVVAGAHLWLMAESDREGEVRRVWEETVERIRDARADDLPRMAESPILHVRPHGRDREDRLPTPHNGAQPKKSFWLRNAYIERIIAGRARP